MTGEKPVRTSGRQELGLYRPRRCGTFTSLDCAARWQLAASQIDVARLRACVLRRPERCVLRWWRNDRSTLPLSRQYGRQRATAYRAESSRISLRRFAGWEVARSLGTECRRPVFERWRDSQSDLRPLRIGRGRRPWGHPTDGKVVEGREAALPRHRFGQHDVRDSASARMDGETAGFGIPFNRCRRSGSGNTSYVGRQSFPESGSFRLCVPPAPPHIATFSVFKCSNLIWLVRVAGHL